MMKIVPAFVYPRLFSGDPRAGSSPSDEQRLHGSLIRLDAEVDAFVERPDQIEDMRHVVRRSVNHCAQ